MIFVSVDPPPIVSTLETILTSIVLFPVVDVLTPVIIPLRYPVNEVVDPDPGIVTPFKKLL